MAAGLWPGALPADEEGGSKEFHFVVVNDLHYHDSRCGPWFEKMVKHLNGQEKKPELCLVVGDLADNGKPEQFGPLRDILKTLQMPYHVVVESGAPISCAAWNTSTASSNAAR